jgi:cytochrome P450
MIVFWHLLYIVSTPGMAQRVRTEIQPFVSLSSPTTIGNISELPKLTINHEHLFRSCPLFKASFFESLRLVNQSWSIRQVNKDVVISSRAPGDEEANKQYRLRNGDYVTMAHELHMLDPAYYTEPTKFLPERFLEMGEDGNVTVNTGTIRPWGGGKFHSLFFAFSPHSVPGADAKN